MDERYRRITAHLNRAPRSGEHAFDRVSSKRVYRIMRLNKLLLPKHTGRVGEHRTHDGKVVTLHSNTRWCSDGFEISCWNKEKVRVVFSLDCCDRKIMSYVAITKDISATMVQDVLVESIEKRFGDTSILPKEVAWLTDNGSCYIFDYIEMFYNVKRRHGFNDQLSPVEYEKRFKNEATECLVS